MLCLAVLAACRGGGGDAPTPPDTATDPTGAAAVVACGDFVDRLCDALMACNPDLSDADCRAAVDGTGLDCACATTHDEVQLGTCFDTLDTATCAELAEDNVPPDCDGMFTLQC